MDDQDLIKKIIEAARQLERLLTEHGGDFDVDVSKIPMITFPSGEGTHYMIDVSHTIRRKIK